MAMKLEECFEGVKGLQREWKEVTGKVTEEAVNCGEESKAWGEIARSFGVSMPCKLAEVLVAAKQDAELVVAEECTSIRGVIRKYPAVGGKSACRFVNTNQCCEQFIGCIRCFSTRT
ncbi:unnamed protein product [Gongylonema pulchrum]|uniref:Uncharacterized protein n=1 Tax=Gongylonema pulchrum TaxID=637853 RepID=A0A183E725_9BILA|nr:unnamed protein product [Gongylonema pulchrum]